MDERKEAYVVEATGPKLADWKAENNAVELTVVSKELWMGV